MQSRWMGSKGRAASIRETGPWSSILGVRKKEEGDLAAHLASDCKDIMLLRGTTKYNNVINQAIPSFPFLCFFFFPPFLWQKAAQKGLSGFGEHEAASILANKAPNWLPIHHVISFEHVEAACVNRE
jgi:hypothetical protein